MKGTLPRLPEEYYCGYAKVFWTHTTLNRESYGLDEKFHHAFREILCHACARYHLVTPVYCLMPDHYHLLWIGISPDSNQLKATRFLRRETRELIQPVSWQRQPHDHVVRAAEQARGIFASTVDYILQNPVRAELVDNWINYPYLGALVPGYPNLDRRMDGFHEKFWKIHDRILQA